MVQDAVRIEDLFPSAVELFDGRRLRRRAQRLRLFAWIVAVALAALLGRRLLIWADRNI